MDFRKSALFSIIIGGVFSIGSLILFVFKTTDLNVNNPISTNIFADFGSLIGGIVGTVFSLAGILLLIQNINLQEQFFLRQQIESRFFELIKIHRENSSEITIKDRSGKKVFLSLQKELFECFKLVKEVNQQFNISEKLLLNVTYQVFFYGAVGEISQQILKDNLREYPGDFVNQLFKAFEDKQKKIQKEFDYKPFEGHQSRLGHYFRHLFQSVKYIDNQPKNLLSYEQKYQYVKSLRAQLSNPEQVILFFNSISDLGKAWELDEEIKDPNYRLITKYNLIKNIPLGYSNLIDIRTYYPDIFYEGQREVTKKRKELSKIYS